MSFEKGIVKNLHYGDILIKFNEILDSCDKKIPFISRDMNFEKIKNAILKNGDVVIADAAEDEAVGKCTEIFNISQNEQIISGLHTIPCRPNIDFAQGFLGYYMNSNSYHSQLVPLMQGIKVLSLSKSSLQDTLITFPRTKKEQARIGTFFRQLDRLVALHQCNCNMATRPCEWSSGLRAIAWEQRKLGEIADIVGGGTPSTNNPSYWNGDIDWYAPAEIGEQIFLTGSQKKITVLGLQKSSATILPVGSVLFTSRAGIGNTAILAKQGATNQGFQSIVPDSQITDSYFIFSRTHELKKYAEIVGAGSTFTEVSGKQMARMPILMPKIDEQVCIGTFFRNLDRLITLHQRKHILLT